MSTMFAFFTFIYTYTQHNSEDNQHKNKNWKTSGRNRHIDRLDHIKQFISLFCIL